MIDLKNVSIGYSTGKETVEVYRNLNVSLANSRFTGLVGDNGVGKSTLLKTLCGYLPTLSGEILLDRQPLSGYSIAGLSTYISIVLPEKITGFNLTAYDVVASGRIPYINAFSKLSPADEDIVWQSMESIGVTALHDRLMEELSDGQRQKVMIAKSLAQQTPVIILDEPTAFLDYTSKHQLFGILKQLCTKHQKLVLVSSHDLELLFDYADDVLMLQGGNRYLFDTPSAVRKEMGI